MDAVRCFVFKIPGEWDECIPQIAGALRYCVNLSTGYTPNMLMLGREVSQPVDVMFLYNDKMPLLMQITI
jgi:hypothetical protein